MSLLRTTRQLLAELTVPPDEQAALCQVIRRRGALADAEAVLDAFLAAPEPRAWLLPIVRKLGDLGTSRRMFEACVVGDALRDGVPSEVLRCLGQCGYVPAEPVLWRYATAPTSDHYVVQDACLGLLDLPCAELGPIIAKALSAHEGKNLFPEFLPVLATKTRNPLWLHRLIRWGRDHASTDCNGGILLGIALFGDRPAFEAVLWDPRWEADASATGSRTWAYAGARALHIEMRDLHATFRARPDAHALRILTALLSCWLDPPALDLSCAPPPAEDALSLHRMLFRWSTPHRDDSLRGLAYDVIPDRHHWIHNELAELDRLVLRQATHDLELAELLEH
ncbi:MAG: hypothetical protein IAG13_05640 [Deltaproteobacteria bacterium]|nr:hypothetical protein [Nannocystaceae bacterium]